MEIEKIITFLKTLIPAEEITERNNYYILPTICHNIDSHSAQHKLYLYKNEDSSPLFHCYTECSETFNIYQFIQKYFKLRNEDLTFREAYKRFHGVDYKKDFVENQEKEIYIKEEFQNPLELKLPEYNENCLNIFSIKYTDPWALEGIDLEILKKYEISYSKSYEGVMIPHRDWRGRLIGLRIRTYNEIKAKNFKYMPAQIGNILYRHPLSLNFYGIFENQTNIKRNKKVYLFEAEKSVLQYAQMFDENISLAVCGKNISKWQMEMLIYFLGVEDLIIGFDKEYNNYSEAFNYVEKIKKQLTFLLNFMNIYVMIDDKNIFNLKESPTDRTLDDFLSMSLWKL